MSDKSNHHQVLFVDDNRDYLEAVGESFRLLSAEDWQLQAANSANQALQIIKSGGMDLVVLDVDFTDGDQFISLLHGCYPKLKIAVMTAEPTNEKRAASIAAGAGLFFEKPVSAEGIQSVFRQLCKLLHWEPSEGFQGVLRRIGLLDLVKIECISRNSSILDLYREHSLGRIYIEDGQIIHAVFGEIFGERAFQRLLAISGGTFELHDYEQPPERTIHRPWDLILADALRFRELAKGQKVAGGTTVGSGWEDGADAPVARAEELLICTGRGEKIYDWQCAHPAARVAMLQAIAQQAAQIVPDWQLGHFDRLEIALPTGRAVLQARADRIMFARFAQTGVPT